jgi:hypothetical protein
MKKLVLILGFTTILFGAISIYFVVDLLLPNPWPSFRVMELEPQQIYEGGKYDLFYVSEHTLEILEFSMTEMNEQRAILYAQANVFNHRNTRVRQPYLIYHDTANGFYIILADCMRGNAVYRIFLCDRTGGLIGPVNILERISLRGDLREYIGYTSSGEG